MDELKIEGFEKPVLVCAGTIKGGAWGCPRTVNEFEFLRIIESKNLTETAEELSKLGVIGFWVIPLCSVQHLASMIIAGTLAEGQASEHDRRHNITDKERVRFPNAPFATIKRSRETSTN